MQVLNVEGFEKRGLQRQHGIRHSAETSAGYLVLRDVVGVTICNFKLWPDQDDRGRFKVPMLSRWRTQERHSGERGLPQVLYVFLELPKYTAGEAPRTPIDRWAYFFRETLVRACPVREDRQRRAFLTRRTASLWNSQGRFGDAVAGARRRHLGAK